MATLTKTDYILRSLTKIPHKRWEFFIVSRIIHGIDSDIEFVTQQLVRKNDGKYYLMDLYFPQFKCYLEINEPGHLKQVEEDERRQRDITLMTGMQQENINIYDDAKKEKGLKTICEEVDDFISKLMSKKKEMGSGFIPWDFDSKYSSEPVIARGHVSIDDNIVFRTQIEAMRCFGFKGKGWQRGAWVIPDGSGDVVWFPRLYKYGIWENSLSADGESISEKAINQAGKDSIEKQMSDGFPGRNYIVFAKAKDPLGYNLLRYVGTFQMDRNSSNPDEIVFNRIRTKESIRT